MLEPSPKVDELARRVIGAAIEVHRHLGPGFIESTYQRALEIELQMQEIPHQREASMEVLYKGNTVGRSSLDFLVDRELVVELKAVESIAPIHQAQVISYLQASKLQLGLIINFNVPVLKEGIKRIVLTSFA